MLVYNCSSKNKRSGCFDFFASPKQGTEARGEKNIAHVATTAQEKQEGRQLHLHIQTFYSSSWFHCWVRVLCRPWCNPDCRSCSSVPPSSDRHHQTDLRVFICGNAQQARSVHVLYGWIYRKTFKVIFSSNLSFYVSSATLTLKQFIIPGNKVNACKSKTPEMISTKPNIFLYFACSVLYIPHRIQNIPF